MNGERLRIRGVVQGVGFRPTVWRLARKLGLAGRVCNDGAGVLIDLWGTLEEREHFLQQLTAEKPPLARIDSVVRESLEGPALEGAFRIVASQVGEVHTGVAADAAICTCCAAEVLNPRNRRYRYPFTNCTHCGPRFSIVSAIPYDRGNTSMAAFPLCADCAREYADPGDRRYHAQPVACAACGPRVWLQDRQGRRIDTDSGDALNVATRMMREGAIIAVKGIGGFHLACDATDERALKQLRERKQRPAKPFALMAANLAMICRYCEVDWREKALLLSPQSPIVLLKRRKSAQGKRSVCELSDLLAPGLGHLGFMLPYSPLHLLLANSFDWPLVMTSGNPRGHPQCTHNDDAHEKLNDIADIWLMHDRDILNRVDDSVARIVADKPRLLRRARGYAPMPMTLPSGFTRAPETLALGGELKNTVCVVKQGEAVLSQYIGDLEDAVTFADYQQAICRYLSLFESKPQQLVTDMHPEYLSTKLGADWSAREGLPLIQVQHHHAHVAACMAENGLPLDHPPVLGVVFDGLGWGVDGTLWGGEFLQVDYRGYRRLGCLSPVHLPGGTQAIRQPWRNTFAHLAAALGWSACRVEFGDLPVVKFLQQQPLDTIQRMMAGGINSPQSSSCGRLFDAVAAALYICPETISYEGQAAIELESLCANPESVEGYPFSFEPRDGLLHLNPAPLWRALMEDIKRGEAITVMVTRFHRGLAMAVVAAVEALRQEFNVRPVIALSGGVFQNRVLLETVNGLLKGKGYSVLLHGQVPANDGGLALGQAVVGAARSLPIASQLTLPA